MRLNSFVGSRCRWMQVLGQSTLNIGTIQGGRAPNVIPDEARAEIFIRLVGDSAETRAKPLRKRWRDWREAKFVLEIPAERFGELPGFETCVVAFATDIPAFDGAWGQPYLLGPGTIHVAHTLEERLSKRELLEAVETLLTAWCGQLQKVMMNRDGSRYPGRDRDGWPALYPVFWRGIHGSR